jgi:hypothetical protein
MNLTLINRLPFKFILRHINGYLIHFEHGKHFEKDVYTDFKFRHIYAISSNGLTFNVTQSYPVLKKISQVNRLVVHPCQMPFFIKQNRFF